MRLFLTCFLTAFLGLMEAVNPCLAQETRPKSFEGIEILTGWGQANLKSNHDYNITPIFVAFDFRLNSFFKFQIEPVFSIVYQPDQNNVEVGNSFLLKAFLLPESHSLRPYVKAGLGVIYMTQHLSEQSTQINFTEHLGIGGHLFFNKDSSLIAEFRFRHTSNGGIKKPNNGIDSYLTLIGISHKF